MSWLDPLLTRIVDQNNPHIVAEEVTKFMAPIAYYVEPGTEEKWWKNQIGAAIKLSAAKPKFPNCKGASK